MEDRPPSEEAIKAFYKDDSWKKARGRYDALKAARGRCRLCGASSHDGTMIVVDHIVPIRIAWSRRFDPTNLQVLCDPCNRGKGSRDQTDWRRPRPADPLEFHIAKKAWRASPVARSLEALVGSQGCKTTEIADELMLARIAAAIFEVDEGDIASVQSAASSLTRKQRLQRAARNVPEIWPDVSRLWPAHARARNRTPEELGQIVGKELPL